MHVILQYGVLFVPQKPSKERLKEIDLEIKEMIRQLDK